MSSPKQFSEVLRQWTETLMHRSFRDFKRFMDDAGLSPSMAGTLMRLHHHHCGVSDIGGHLGITNAAASQMVDRLVQMGLVERSEDPADRRVKHITLTSKGRALVEAGIEAGRSWMEELTTALSPEQHEVIITALTMLTEAARKLDQEQRTKEPPHRFQKGNSL